MPINKCVIGRGNISVFLWVFDAVVVQGKHYIVFYGVQCVCDNDVLVELASIIRNELAIYLDFYLSYVDGGKFLTLKLGLNEYHIVEIGH